jgi:hypothetical protein
MSVADELRSLSSSRTQVVWIDLDPNRPRKPKIQTYLDAFIALE